MTSLSDKEVCYNNLICFPHKDVKEAIKNLIDFCNIHKGTLIVADTLKEIIIEELGKELCSEKSK